MYYLFRDDVHLDTQLDNARKAVFANIRIFYNKNLSKICANPSRLSTLLSHHVHRNWIGKSRAQNKWVHACKFWISDFNLESEFWFWIMNFDFEFRIQMLDFRILILNFEI